MKQVDSRILIGVIAVLTAGLIGVLGTSSTPLAIGTSTIDGFQDGTGMLGHLTLVSTDSDGQITSYQQTDNLITRRGTDCFAHILFEPTNVAGGSSTCSGDPSIFNAIAIGTGNGQVDTSNALAAETSVSGLVPDTDANGVLVTDDGDGSGSTAVVEVTFTSAGATTSVTEAGIFNSTTTGGTTQMMAYRDFTAISLDSGDSLTVTWTITVA